MEENKFSEERKAETAFEERLRKKSRNRSIISWLLILAGISIIVVPLIGRQMNNDLQEDMLANFYLELEQNQGNEAAIEELDGIFEWATEAENQEALNLAALEIADIPLDNPEGGALAEAGGLKIMPKIIGVIKIDKIDLELPIGEGTDLDTLKFTNGTMPGKALMGALGKKGLIWERKIYL